MSNQRSKRAQLVPKTETAALSAAEVKTRLREQGYTLKSWAQKRGYPYDTVSNVVRGINRATYGLGHRIAVELGLKRA